MLDLDRNTSLAIVPVDLRLRSFLLEVSSAATDGGMYSDVDLCACVGCRGVVSNSGTLIDVGSSLLESVGLIRELGSSLLAGTFQFTLLVNVESALHRHIPLFRSSAMSALGNPLILYFESGKSSFLRCKDIVITES